MQGDQGASPQKYFLEFSFSEVDFSAILICTYMYMYKYSVYIAMHNFSNALHREQSAPVCDVTL